MNAHNRPLPEWFNRIRSRQITLPRFQRSGVGVWRHKEVSGLLTTVLRGLPSGAALILEVGDKPKFESRPMAGAPESGERVVEQLLDGQQRLTALWRSLHDNYHDKDEDRTYLIAFADDPDNAQATLPHVEGHARWDKNGKRYPEWIDIPRECWSRGFIPIKLLQPGDTFQEIQGWTARAVPDDQEKRSALLNDILRLRDKVTTFNLPFLALPAQTPKEVALDVFIKMNTSSVKLSTYDIVVALAERKTGESLHARVDALKIAVPRAKEYCDLPSLVLDVVALRQDRVPSQAGYEKINYTNLLSEWDIVVKGIKGLVGFLEDEGVFDAQRLPSYTALPVIAALWEYLPTQPDKLGNARHLLRRFLWRAFLTSRYEQSSTSSALQDYRGLRRVICGDAAEDTVPILREELPSKEMVLHADWPKRNSILGRGLLALQLKCGAEDIADGTKATVASITSKNPKREYHHLFPASTLKDAGIPQEQIFRALNCALITGPTNRTVSNKDPITYLKERADNGALGVEDLKRRLRTHLIPYKRLAVGYDGMSEDVWRTQVTGDYALFLSTRAEILAKTVQLACAGHALDLTEIFKDVD